MPSIYSKSGCTQCKIRRKKCSEQKPACHACLRHGVECSYDNRPLRPAERQRTVRLGTFAQDSPLLLVRRLPTIHFTAAEDEYMLARIPALLDWLYVPSCSTDNRHVPTLMQMTLGEQHVCDSMVACWSGILSLDRNENIQFNEQAWGRALSTVRNKICTEMDAQTIFTLQIAIFFLFGLESIGPQITADLSRHWKPMAFLIGQLEEAHPGAWTSFPHGLYIIALEGAMYQAILSVFVPDRELLLPMWQYAALSSKLSVVNPPGPSQVVRSPLLGGQYDIYEMVFQLMILFRVPTLTQEQQQMLQNFECRTLRIRANFRSCITQSRISAPAGWPEVIPTYDLICISLLICIYTLKTSSPVNISYIKSRVEEGIKDFIRIKVDPQNLIPILWAVQVLLCAIEESTDHEAFLTPFYDLQKLFCPGPLERALNLLKRVKAVQAQPPSDKETSLRARHGDEGKPRCMLLFRQENGLLGCDF